MQLINFILIFVIACYCGISVYLLFLTITNKKIIKNNSNEAKEYKRHQLFLIIYQLIAGIIIFIGYEKTNSFLPQLLFLLPLIINTISLILFIVNNKEKRETLNIKINIISILAIICGLLFSVNYIISLKHNVDLGYRNDLREVLYLEIYDKPEAKKLLDNLYNALDNNDYDLECINLSSIWQDKTKENIFYINLNETCKTESFPANAIKLQVKKDNKTEIDKIYWQFNDDFKIILYENDKQVSEFNYIYNAMLYMSEPIYEIKYQFEDDVKEHLKSPSSAVFSYNSFRYSESENRFYYYGWVESQNSFGAIVKTDFNLKLIPCEQNYCDYYSLDYTWNFK